jgi:uncharacterized protein
MTDNAVSPRPCARCGKPVVHRFRPFCSARCRDVDLGRWLTESYTVPGDPLPDAPDSDAD